MGDEFLILLFSFNLVIFLKFTSPPPVIKCFRVAKRLASVLKGKENLTEAYSAQNQRFGSAGSNIKVNSVRNDAQLSQEKTPHTSVSYAFWLHMHSGPLEYMCNS